MLKWVFIRVVVREHKYCDNFYGSFNGFLFFPSIRIHQNVYSTAIAGDVSGYEQENVYFCEQNPLSPH